MLSEYLVSDTRIELVTSSVSGKRSSSELITHVHRTKGILPFRGVSVNPELNKFRKNLQQVGELFFDAGINYFDAAERNASEPALLFSAVATSASIKALLKPDC